MDKRTVIHPHDGIPLSNRKEQTIDTHNPLDESQLALCGLKEASLQGLHSAQFHVISSKRQTYRYWGYIGVCQELGAWGFYKEVAQECFGGDRTVLCPVIILIHQSGDAHRTARSQKMQFLLCVNLKK